MEHRWNMRLPKSIKVLLYHNSIPVVACNTRDICLEGVFVESGPLMYRNNTVLEVQFEFVENCTSHLYRLPASVAHISKEGMGLFLHDSDSEAIAAWRIVVQRRDSQLSVEESDSNPMAVLA